MMEKNAKIYVAGHRGMVGSAIVRELQRQGYTNIFTRTHKELDLTRQDAVDEFFAQEKPEYVFLAAAKVGGKVIGDDVDQNYLGVEGVESGKYKANPFVTSAMKGLGAAVKNGLDTVNAGDWSTIAGTNGNFGLEEGDYVGLPTEEASWNFSTFTIHQYNTVLEKIRNGEIKVDNTSDDATKPTTSSNITVDYQV